jgi:hypothetical protein
MTRHLVIPDPHAHPDYHNKRFTWVGKLVADLKPDHVICIGDWADMPSLCMYDYGTKGYEGRRYVKDVEAAIKAQDKFRYPINKRKRKLPKFWMLEGNHEHRISKAVDNDAKLEGVLSLDDLQYKEHGWEVVPYRGTTPGILTIDGISYAHYFPSGVMGRAVSGVNPAYQLVVKYGSSCTQGHIHTFAYYHRGNAMNDVAGLVCGVYQDWEADYAGAANDMWWRGVVVKDNVENGKYDLRQIGLDSLRSTYS